MQVFRTLVDCQAISSIPLADVTDIASRQACRRRCASARRGWSSLIVAAARQDSPNDPGQLVGQGDDRDGSDAFAEPFSGSTP